MGAGAVFHDNRVEVEPVGNGREPGAAQRFARA